MMRPSSARVALSVVGLGLILQSCSSQQETPSPERGGASATGGDGADSGRPATGNTAGGGASSAGHSASGGRPESTGGAGSSAGLGGVSNAAGAAAGSPPRGGAAGAPGARCDEPSLVWRSANKTNYESYPDPGSQECIEFNGCTWEGQFAACDGKKPEAWVMAHDIVAAFPDFADLELHELCLRKGDKTIVVTVLDTCGDSDCDGCCTENQGSAEQLIDVEKYTNERWGVADGRIEWADLGPTRGDGCE